VVRSLGVAPHVHQQLLTTEDHSRPGQEVGEQVEFDRCEVDLCLAESDLPGRRVELEPTMAEDHAVGSIRHPPEHGPDARHELARAERLGEVVVRPDRQPDHEIGLVVAGGEHDHRDPSLGLDPPAHFQPVEAGQHQVEDDEVGLEPAALLHRRRPVRHRPGVVPLAPKALHDRVRDLGLVLHHQHHRHRRPGYETPVQRSCASCGDFVQTATNDDFGAVRPS
jgi:hypothetical protein